MMTVSPESMLKLIQSTISADAVRRMAEQFKLAAKQKGMPKAMLAFADELNELAAYRAIEANLAKNWSGKEYQASPFKTLHEQLLQTSLQKLALQSLCMHYAVDAEAHFMRAYTSEDAVLDPEQIDLADGLLQAWFVNQSLACSQGRLYHADLEGRIKEPVATQYLLQLLLDPEKGLVAFVQSFNPSFRFKLKEQP